MKTIKLKTEYTSTNLEKEVPLVNNIYNEDCLITMSKLTKTVDVILTSPPYNTSRKSKDLYNKRYDIYSDFRTDKEYLDWTIKIFTAFDSILKTDGCILYNLSYSSENTSLMWLVIAEIINSTNFTTVDTIIWKKEKAFPNNRSKNKLTRIVEYVFVFARKSEIKTFNTNKKVVSVVKKTGQKNYENIYNFFEARNYNVATELNKAVFSTDFVKNLLKIYAPENSIVYDPFSGTGTTAKACIESKINFIGSEISPEQVKFSKVRLAS